MEPSSLFLGMYVNVDPESRVGRRDSAGGAGIIVSVEPSTSIRYLIEGRLTQDVDEERIHSMSMMTTSRRPGPNGQTIPGLLSYNYSSFSASAAAVNNTTKSVIKVVCISIHWKYNREVREQC